MADLMTALLMLCIMVVLFERFRPIELQPNIPRIVHARLSAYLATAVVVFVALSLVSFYSNIESTNLFLGVAWVVYSILVCLMLAYSPLRIYLKTVCAVLVAIFILVGFTAEGGIQKSVEKLDLILQSDAVDSASSDNTTSGNSESLKDQSNDGAPTSGLGRLAAGRLRLSQAVMFLYYGIMSFAPLYYFGWLYRQRQETKPDIERFAMDADALGRAVSVLSIVVAIVVALTLSGADILQVGVVTAILGAGISVASRDLLVNFAAGLVLLWDKSVKPNDVIYVDGMVGVVKLISMRYTVIKDRNEIHLIVPNMDLINSRIQNWTQKENMVRIKLDLSVSYDADLATVFEIMRDTCFHVERVHSDQPPKPFIMGFGGSGIDLQLRFWIDDADAGVRNVMSQVYEYLLAQFAEAEPRIEVPYSQMEVRMIEPPIKAAPKTVGEA